MQTPSHYLLSFDTPSNLLSLGLHNLLISWHAKRLCRHSWYLETRLHHLAEPILDELKKHLGEKDRVVVVQCQQLALFNTLTNPFNASR